MNRQEEIRNELAQIELEGEWPQLQVDELRSRIATLRQQAQARDWVLVQTSATRPPDSITDGTQDKTEQVRTRLLQDARKLDGELREWDDRLSKLRSSESRLRNALRTIECDSITPAMLAGQIKSANAELAQFNGTRHRKDKDLQHAQDQRERVRQALAAEEQANHELESAQAVAFLDASDGAGAAVTAAKRALQAARERANAARAALPEIERRVQAAQAVLDTFDGECAEHRQRITDLERQHGALKARLSFNAAVVAQRRALCDLYAVDPDAAMRQGEALHARGLFVLDADGELQRPGWLQAGHTRTSLRRVLSQGAV